MATRSVVYRRLALLGLKVRKFCLDGFNVKAGLFERFQETRTIFGMAGNGATGIPLAFFELFFTGNPSSKTIDIQPQFQLCQYHSSNLKLTWE